MEFSAQFNDGYDTGASDVEDMVRVQEGKMILYYNGVMGNFREYTRYRELSGENGLLIGFPSIEGCSPEITEIIGRIKPRQEYYLEIEEIITEEIGIYWHGSKTVQEVMEIIQNRSQLYLDEGNMVQ